jgi:hypothetical protein
VRSAVSQLKVGVVSTPAPVGEESALREAAERAVATPGVVTQEQAPDGRMSLSMLHQQPGSSGPLSPVRSCLGPARGGHDRPYTRLALLFLYFSCFASSRLNPLPTAHPRFRCKQEADSDLYDSVDGDDDY